MSKHYEAVKQRLASGWNTWNTRSVLSHVRLPEGVAVNLVLKEYKSGACLREALIGRQGEEVERIHPGPRSYDGGYSELRLWWRDIEIEVRSAVEGDDLMLLVTPVANQIRPVTLAVELAVLWNRSGVLRREGDALLAETPSGVIRVHVAGTVYDETQIDGFTPFLPVTLDAPVAVSTGARRSVEEVRAILDDRKAALESERKALYGDLAEVYTAVQTCMAWDTIYDAKNDRVVSPVSRIWSSSQGGYVLFCWDTYFAAWMAALDNRDLAYANAIEITREVTENGFVPNVANAHGFKSRDRSQPPVGSRTVWDIYRRFGETWFLEEVYDVLLEWNRWWVKARDTDGLLCWGSDLFEPVVGNFWELHGVNERFGGALESGLDNSPMYDDVPFDQERCQLMLQDVGLTGLYVMDCDALARIASELNRESDAAEIRARAESYRSALRERLWDDAHASFCNRRPDTGEFCHRLSPTNLYALLGRSALPEQAERMMQAHFWNTDEFAGEWILPSIIRNDPAYPEQCYWRGRIWAPMNFLVYLGLLEYDLPKERAELVEKSKALLLKEWRENGHVHENYNADTGEGCDIGSSDRFYHWGGLLGTIALMEAGHYGTTPPGGAK